VSEVTREAKFLFGSKIQEKGDALKNRWLFAIQIERNKGNCGQRSSAG